MKLAVSNNRRFLIHEDGTPFFYLGDTAWELFHRLNREEADIYLRNRAENNPHSVRWHARVFSAEEKQSFRLGWGLEPLQS